MTPRVTVLQLDTRFPRIAGDVGSADSYARPPQIIRITGASVGRIVTDRPQDIDITPFEDALHHATGDLIVTSCGFLSYWQDHLAALADRPFIASALGALDHLHTQYPPHALRILTFDAAKLGAAHLGQYPHYAASITGLPPAHHLRAVISGNAATLDHDIARRETVGHMVQTQSPAHQHIVLECTNLPPYRAALEAATGLPVTDILTQIEKACPHSIAAAFRRGTD